VVLTFDEPLEPSRASDLGNYAVAEMGRAGQRGFRSERPVRVASVAYDAATKTVTLRVRGTFHAGRTYRVLFDAAPPRGVVGSDGVAPVGDSAGQVAVPFSPGRARIHG
jgi:hypothetical protein